MVALALAFFLLPTVLLPGFALAQPLPAGRYQVTAVAGTPPVVVMHDTGTGQSWILVQTPGPPVQWAPLRFWSTGNALTALPPTPSTVGIRAPSEAPPPR